MFEISSHTGSSAHPLGVALAEVQRTIEGVEDTPAWGLRSDELAGLVQLQEAVTAQLATLGLGLVREADRRDLGAAVGATSTADWLRDRLCLDHGAAKGRVELAALLDVDADLLAAAETVHDTAWGDDAAVAHDTGYPVPVRDTAGRSEPDDGAAETSAESVAAVGTGDSGDVTRTGLGIDAAAVSELAVAARRFLPCTAWALRAGRIGVEHALAIRRALKRLPAGLDVVVWAECEAFLAVQATRHSPRNLARLGSHLATSVTGAHELARQQEREAAQEQEREAAQEREREAAWAHSAADEPGPTGNSSAGEDSAAGEHSEAGEAIATGGSEAGDHSHADENSASGVGMGEHNAAGSAFGADDAAGGCVLDNDLIEQRAEASTMFGFIDDGDGTVRVYGRFSAEAADVITSALAPLAAPQPAEDGTPDPRGHARRMGDALVELCRRALDAGDVLPGARGARPHVTITASLPTLRKQPGCSKAVSMWGTPITPEALRRIACDAGVSRVLTDAAGVPLDVGRAYRTVTPAQWVALVARDKGCAFPGCSRPAAWAQAHHIKHWADGGATDLANLVLLCGYHHRSVHHRGWTVRIGADGHPEFLPPPWVDPDRRPRRNTYHRIVDALGDDMLSGSGTGSGAVSGWPDGGRAGAGPPGMGRADADRVDAGRRGAGSEDSGSVDSGSVDSGSVDVDRLDAERAGTDAVDADRVGTGRRCIGSEDSGSEDSGSVDSGRVDAGRRGAGSVDVDRVDAERAGTDAVDADRVDAGRRGTGSEDSGSEDAGSEGSGRVDADGVGTDPPADGGQVVQPTVRPGRRDPPRQSSAA